MTATCAFDLTLDQVTLNPRYAVPLDASRFALTYVPAGLWVVKVRERGQQWITFAVPRHTNPGDPFLIAVGDDRASVFGVGLRWASQAKTLTCHIDRVGFAGYGNATGERLNTDDLDSRWAVLDTQEHR